MMHRLFSDKVLMSLAILSVVTLAVSRFVDIEIAVEVLRQ